METICLINSLHQDLKTSRPQDPKTKISRLGMCMPQDCWDRFYEEYRQFLETIGVAVVDEEGGSETDVETVEDDSFEQVDESGLIQATPEGSDWGDDEIDNLPSLDDFLPK